MAVDVGTVAMMARVGATSQPRIAVVARGPSTLLPKLRVVVEAACGGARAIATKGKTKANIAHQVVWHINVVDALSATVRLHQLLRLHQLHLQCQARAAVRLAVLAEIVAMMVQPGAMALPRIAKSARGPSNLQARPQLVMAVMESEPLSGVAQAQGVKSRC